MMIGSLHRALLLLFICAFAANSLAQQPVPASPQTESVIILNGTAHIGNGEVIRKAAIGMRDGKIDLVGKAGSAVAAQYDRVINADGKHIYPGFIAPNSTLGLQEIGAVRASRDQRETGQFNPNVRSLIAYNTDSRITPTVRTNGVLVAQITPRGGSISGSSSIVNLDGWNWEDAVLSADDGIHLNWPVKVNRRGWWAEPKPGEANKKYKAGTDKIKKFFTEAQAYSKSTEQKEIDLKLHAMRGLFDTTSTLYIHINYAREMIQAIDMAKDFGIARIVIVGGYEAHLVAEKLLQENVPVILRRVHALPMKQHEDVDLPYKLPKLLRDKGILFCLNNAGDMEQMGTRNLPFYAGTACAYGLEEEEAVAALTLNAAKILGVDSLIGSLEMGKQATLFISSGDALDMMTNNIEHAFIQGKTLDLRNHQKGLYERFKTKYENQR